MAHNYVGADDPAAIVPAVPIAGKGVFATAVVVDDQDDRDAGSAMAGIEANADKINWLVWRMINIVDGAVTAFTTAIQISNPWTTLARVVYKGPNAWVEKRAALSAGVVNGNLVNVITPMNGDLWLLDTVITSATRVLLVPFTGPGVIEFTLHRPALGSASTSALPIYDTAYAAGVPYLVSIAPNVADFAATIHVKWDGTRYIIQSKYSQTPAYTGATI